MNKKDVLYSFIKEIEKEKKLTAFIKDIFGYEELYDYNYIFRITATKSKVIIDIYDNVSINRFNRYIFNYSKSKYNTNITKKDNVYITNINVLKIEDSENKLYKLAYLTKLRRNNMVEYANTFLDKEFVEIVENIIKNKSNL